MAICLVTDRDERVYEGRFHKVGKISDLYDLSQIAVIKGATFGEAILNICCEIASCPALLEDKRFIANVFLF